MTFEFIEQLPEKRSRRVTPGTMKSKLFEDFAEVLRQNPQQWAKYPGNNKTVRQIAWGIRNQRGPAPLALQTGEFEAEVRDGVLYVRWCPAENTSCVSSI